MSHPDLPAYADDCVADIMDLALASHFALRAFASVASVEWSTGVATACVECVHRPRLLLNPAFVAERCGTRERLAMLVLHELSHISLGHTRLYPRLTPAHNVAFDAVINAHILHSLRALDIDASLYAELLTDCYQATESPLFILRPPPGWPDARDWDASAGCPDALRAIHRRLYSPRGPDREGVTYTEIVLALQEGHATACEAAQARLLGAHGLTPEEQYALACARDGNAAEAFPAAISALLGEASPGGWGGRQDEAEHAIAGHRAERRLQQALRKLLRQVFVESVQGAPRVGHEVTPFVSVDPTRDRRAPALRLLAHHFGAPRPLLFDARELRQRRDRHAATLYLDVSGSMTGMLERLHAALVPLRRLLAPDVFAFSCDVSPTPVARFVAGSVRTSWGTEITPVLRHAASAPGRRGARRRALVLTDGYFAAPRPDAVRALRESRTELHVAVIGDGPLPTGDWVASATRLPKPDPSRGQP